MNWLVDEGMPKGLVDWLRQRGDDVLDVAETEWRRAKDEKLWRLAGKQRRTVITRDLGFMHPDIKPSPLGIVLVRPPKSFRAKAIVRMVQEELTKLPEYKLYGNITVIEPGRVRQCPLSAMRRKERSETRRCISDG